MESEVYIKSKIVKWITKYIAGDYHVTVQLAGPVTVSSVETRNIPENIKLNISLQSQRNLTFNFGHKCTTNENNANHLKSIFNKVI